MGKMEKVSDEMMENVAGGTLSHLRRTVRGRAFRSRFPQLLLADLR